MRSKLVVCLLLTVAFVAGTVSAGNQIVYFTNGTTLAIRGHNVEDGMVHVDLGGDAFMAFPEYMVDKIEEAGKNVYIEPSHRKANVSAARQGNVSVRGGFNGDRHAQRGTSSVNSGMAGRDVSDSGVVGRAQQAYQTGSIKPDDRGIETKFLSSHSNKKARKMGAQGDMTILEGMDGRGTRRFGNKQVLMTEEARKHLEISDVKRLAPKAMPPPTKKTPDTQTEPGTASTDPSSDN